MKFAVACADGMGDGLIMSIIAHHLRLQGHEVTVFNPYLPSFGKYLEKGDYQSNTQNWEEVLKPFDATILQHEDTSRAQEICLLRQKGYCIYSIYTNYRFYKHGAITPFDYPVDEQKPMVENIQMAFEKFFSKTTSKQNCLLPKLPLPHRQNKQRVLLHPTSGNVAKNWRKEGFLKLACLLEKKGWEPLFLLSPQERPSWPENIHAPHFATLESLTETIYQSGFLIGNDSGPAHLASYYQIPHLVICQGRQMPLWQTGWLAPYLVLPPPFILNIKGLRLREKYWSQCITAKRVYRSFQTERSMN